MLSAFSSLLYSYFENFISNEKSYFEFLLKFIFQWVIYGSSKTLIIRFNLCTNIIFTNYSLRILTKKKRNINNHWKFKIKNCSTEKNGCFWNILKGSTIWKNEFMSFTKQKIIFVWSKAMSFHRTTACLSKLLSPFITKTFPLLSSLIISTWLQVGSSQVVYLPSSQFCIHKPVLKWVPKEQYLIIWCNNETFVCYKGQRKLWGRVVQPSKHTTIF